MLRPNSTIGIILVVIFGLVSLSFFFSALYQRYRLVRMGREEDRFHHILKRLAGVIAPVFGQRTLLRGVTSRDRAGITHFFIFWGAIAFILGYLFFVFGSAFSRNFAVNLIGQGGAWVLSFAADVLGMAALIAVIWGLIRRFLVRPPRQTASLAWLYFSGTIALLLSTYFVMEALRIPVGDAASGSRFPVGVLLADALSRAGLTENQRALWYTLLWWFEFALIVAFLIHSRYSEHFHAIAAPLNFFFQSLKPKGELTPIDRETAGGFSRPSLKNLTWKGLLDGLSCTECGRCQEACPAYAGGKVLNPKEVIQQIRKQLVTDGPALLKGMTDGEEGLFAGNGEGILEEAVWDCTTCGACQQACPVAIEHVGLFIDLRRQLIERGAMGPSTRVALENIHALGNPWGESQTARSELISRLRLPEIQKEGEAEFLYWIGCASVYDDRARAVTEAVAGLLSGAGVRFAVLGAEEKCCGDPSRRLGEEGLFQKRALENIETLERYGVKRVIAHCPHCYNALRNEYRQLGADLEVMHHSELILDLIRRGKIVPSRPLDYRLTIHDPCYLGRYNHLHETLRQVVAVNREIEIVEMKNNRDKGFCCGAGGGHLWMPGGKGTRMENMRLAEALETGSQVIASACPYCVIMLDSAASTMEAGRIKVMDMAELITETL